MENKETYRYYDVRKLYEGKEVVVFAKSEEDAKRYYIDYVALALPNELSVCALNEEMIALAFKLNKEIHRAPY